MCEPTSTSPVVVASRRAAHVSGVPSSGKLEVLVEEARGDVERDGHAVVDEHRQRLVGEVVGAVVEGDRDHRRSRGVGIGEAGEAVVEADHGAGSGEVRHLLGELRAGEVDLEAAAPADPVVDEHHEARRRPSHHPGAAAPTFTAVRSTPTAQP